MVGEEERGGGGAGLDVEAPEAVEELGQGGGRGVVDVDGDFVGLEEVEEILHGSWGGEVRELSLIHI